MQCYHDKAVARPQLTEACWAAWRIYTLTVYCYEWLWCKTHHASETKSGVYLVIYITRREEVA